MDITFSLVFSLFCANTIASFPGQNACSYDIVLNPRQCKESTSPLQSMGDISTCQFLKDHIMELKEMSRELRMYADVDDPVEIIDITQQSNLTEIESLISSPTTTDNEKKLLRATVQKYIQIEALQANIDQVETKLRSYADNIHLLDTESNSVKAIINQVKDNTKKEVDKLTEQIANITRDANSCNGIHWGITQTSPEYYDAILPLYCSFDASHHSSCGFTQGGGKSDVNWNIISAAKNSKAGPKEDHTFGSPKGKYLFLRPAINGTLAKLHSPMLKPAPSYCVRFWYNMYDIDGKQIRVYTGWHGKKHDLWTTFGTEGEAWHMGELDIDPQYTSHNFHVMFDAIHNNTLATHQTGLSDVTLDDIYFYNVSCKSIPTCPIGSVTRKQNGSSSCYTFHPTPDNWYNGQKACHREGATSHLVSVNSKDEQDYIIDIIKSNPALRAAGIYGWYTSGNDERSEGHFDWTDTGTPYRSQFSDWHPGQPNNVGGDQDCLLLQYADDDYEWGDVVCTENHPYICEVDLPTS